MSSEKRDQPAKPERPRRELSLRLPFFGRVKIALEGKSQAVEKPEQFFNDVAWKILEKSPNLEYKDLHQAGDPFLMDGKVLHPLYADTMPDTTFHDTHLKLYAFDNSGQERAHFNASLDKDHGRLDIFSLVDTSDPIEKGVKVRRAKVAMATLVHLLESDQFEGFAPFHSSEDTYGCLDEMISHLVDHPEIRPIGDLAFVLSESAKRDRDEQDNPFENSDRDSHRTEWDMQAEYLENALMVGYKTTEVQELTPLTVDGRQLHLFAVKPNSRYNTKSIYFCTFDEKGQEVSITTAELQGDDRIITIEQPVMIPLYRQATSPREKIQNLTKTIEPIGQAVIEALRRSGEFKVVDKSQASTGLTGNWGEDNKYSSISDQTARLSRLTQTNKPEANPGQSSDDDKLLSL